MTGFAPSNTGEHPGEILDPGRGSEEGYENGGRGVSIYVYEGACNARGCRKLVSD